MSDRTILPTLQPAHVTRYESDLVARVDLIDSEWHNDAEFGARKRAMFYSWCAQQANAELGGRESWPSPCFESLAPFRRLCERTADWLVCVRNLHDRAAVGLRPFHALRDAALRQSANLLAEMSNSPLAPRYLVVSAVEKTIQRNEPPMWVPVRLLVEGLVQADCEKHYHALNRETTLSLKAGLVTGALAIVDRAPEFRKPAGEAVESTTP